MKSSKCPFCGADGYATNYGCRWDCCTMLIGDTYVRNFNCYETELATQEEVDVLQPNFEQELRDVINKHSQENISNTPDFILMQYVLSCLESFNTATQQRETCYGGTQGQWEGETSRPCCGRKMNKEVQNGQG